MEQPDSIDQLARERRLEQKIDAACERLMRDLEIIRDQSNVTKNNIGDMSSISLYLEYIEAYAIKARMLLCTTASKETTYNKTKT